MKQLILPLVLAASASVNAQYNRSLFYHAEGSTINQSAMVAESGQLMTFSSFQSSEDTLVISWSALNPAGDVINAGTLQQLNSAFGPKTYISWAFSEGNDLYVLVLLTEEPSNMQTMSYIRMNAATGGVSNSYFAATLLKAGFTESIQNGTQLVSYVVDPAAGLCRVALNRATFSAAATEVVDATQLSGVSLNTNRKQSEAMLFNGAEHLIFSGNSAVNVYKRTAPSSYLAHANGAAGGSKIDLTVNGSNQLVTVSATDYYIYDNNFALVANGLLNGVPVNTNSSSEFIFHNGAYYRMTSGNASSNAITVEQFSSSFAIVGSTQLRNSSRIRKAIAAGNTIYIAGDVQNSSYVQSVNAQGISSEVSTVPFFAKTSDLLLIPDFSEYGQAFRQHDLHFKLGQNNVYFTTDQNRASGKLALNGQEVALMYFAKGLFAGKNPQDQLVGSGATMYESDLLVGPYTTAGNHSPVQDSKYNRGFFVTKAMIETHIDSLQTGTAAYVAPHGIREWPAHGDPNKGQAEDLAGFVDVDNDGTYEPYEGDYPKIYGDNCFLSLAHQPSGVANSANVEVHTYFYSFDCPADSSYYNAIFVKQRYIPRAFAVDSFYVGSFADPDLGNYNNDYVGTNVELGMIYSYNGELFDGPNSGLPGFGEKSPAQGLIFLKGSKLGNDGLDNAIGTGVNQSVNGYGFQDATIDNEFYTLEASQMYMNGTPASLSTPETLPQSYLVLQGYYAFGDPQFYGGPNATTIETTYFFPGESDPLNYGTNGVDPGFESSEQQANAPYGDRRMIGATGMSQLAVGEIMEYDFAYLCTYDTTHVNTSILDPVDRLFAIAATIKGDFQANAGPCGLNFGTIDESLAVTETVQDPFTVYPNPTNGMLTVNGFGEGAYTVTVYDMNGRLLETKTLNKTANSLSVQEYSGTVFLVHISNGAQTAIKRVVKQ